MILIFIMHALFGLSFPLSKVLLRYSPPILFTAIRMMIAGGILLLYQVGYARSHFQFHRKHLLMYFQIIFFGVYITYILRFWALEQLSPAKTAFFFNLAPFFTALYAYFMEKERLKTLQWAGLIIGFLGVLPIILSSSVMGKSGGSLLVFSWAEIAILLAVATHSYSWMIMRRLIRVEKYPPTMINGICYAIGGTASLFTSLAVETSRPIADLGYFISLLMIVILVSNIISHNLYGYLLKQHYSPTFLSFTGFLGPLFAALYQWLFANEKITWHLGLSTCLVLCGLYLFYRQELKSEGIQTTS